MVLENYSRACLCCRYLDAVLTDYTVLFLTWCGPHEVVLLKYFLVQSQAAKKRSQTKTKLEFQPCLHVSAYASSVGVLLGAHLRAGIARG
jgi:hypothetical protein